MRVSFNLAVRVAADRSLFTAYAGGYVLSFFASDEEAAIALRTTPDVIANMSPLQGTKGLTKAERHAMAITVDKPLLYWTMVEGRPAMVIRNGKVVVNNAGTPELALSVTESLGAWGKPFYQHEVELPTAETAAALQRKLDLAAAEARVVVPVKPAAKPRTKRTTTRTTTRKTAK